MKSVSKRIKEVVQPRGGFINLSLFQTKVFCDSDNVSIEDESPIITGLAVDYLTRMSLTHNAKDAFKTSILGSTVAEDLGGIEGARINALNLLKGIDGLNDSSIINACKLVTYDVWCRNPNGALLSQDHSEINPSTAQISMIRSLVNRSIKFFRQQQPLICCGFGFHPEDPNESDIKRFYDGEIDSYGGYTSTVSKGDADYLTTDTIWDLKVSKRKPDKDATLQILMYWIMGQHSGRSIFNNISKIGIFNPRLNTSYVLEISRIPKDIINTVERDIICYP